MIIFSTIGSPRYYSYRPIDGTPYQLVLTAVDREIQKAATDLEDKIQGGVIAHVVVTSIIFAGTLLFLISISAWFNRGFVDPVKKLVKLVRQGEGNGYADDVEIPDRPCALELQSTLKNFQKLLIGLRFGNTQYHKGNKLRELRALRDARALMAETGNERGMGVCLSNLGNFSRAANPEVKAGLVGDESEPVKLLEQAVENARNLAATPNNDVGEDTVGQRLLGLGLAHLSNNDLEKAATSLEEAVAIHKRTEAWGNLVRLASVVLTKIDDENTRLLSKIVVDAVEGCVSILLAGNKEISAHQQSDLAKLCQVLCWQGTLLAQTPPGNN